MNHIKKQFAATRPALIRNDSRFLDLAHWLLLFLFCLPFWFLGVVAGTVYHALLAGFKDSDSNKILD